MQNHKPGKPTPFTRKIERFLLNLDIGEIAEYEKLNELTGLECQAGGDGYGYVQSAIRRCEKVGFCFDCIQNVGYERVDENGKLDHISRKQRIIKRRNKRNAVILSVVDVEKLSPEKIPLFSAQTLSTAYVGRISSNRNQQKMIEQFSKQQNPLEIDYEKMTETYLRKK